MSLTPSTLSPPAPGAEAGCAASSGPLSLWTAITLQGPQQLTSQNTAARFCCQSSLTQQTGLHPGGGPAHRDTNKGQELLCV